MLPLRYRRAKLAQQLRTFHPGHHEFIRERLRAFDERNGRDKMIPLSHRKLKPSPYTHRPAMLPPDRAPMISS